MPELMKTKEEIIQKADELATEYEKKYGGCCESTFYAVVDALRWGGLEILPEEMASKLFPGICLLTAGVCMTGEGTCGAVAGSVLAGGFAYGVSADPADSNRVGAVLRDSLLAEFYNKYGSILCKDVMRKYFGKAWDLTSEEMTMEFLSITDGCVIRSTAKWMTGFLLDEYEKGNLKIPS
jgi:hypothetical protein